MTTAEGRLAWLLSLALVAAGVLAAHGLAYRLVEPDAEERRHLLEETGHGYLDPALFGSLFAALILIGFTGRVLAGTRRTDALPLWFFALAPPVGFALQELAEQALHNGALSTQALLAPTFAVGLVLQLPFAFFAFLAARALLSTADALAARAAAAPRPRLAPDASLAVPVSDWTPPAPTLFGARGQRAPPR